MRVLFICTGNTCRSCMAEAIFNTNRKSDNIIAISAGIAANELDKTSKNSAIIVKEECGIDISSRTSVRLTVNLLKEADLVLTMTSYMSNVLIDKFPQFKSKIHSLNEYVGIKGDVVDPYGGDIAIYKNTYNNLRESILLLLHKLQEDKGE